MTHVWIGGGVIIVSLWKQSNSLLLLHFQLFIISFGTKIHFAWHPNMYLDSSNWVMGHSAGAWIPQFWTLMFLFVSFSCTFFFSLCHFVGAFFPLSTCLHAASFYGWCQRCLLLQMLVNKIKSIYHNKNINIFCYYFSREMDHIYVFPV